MTRKMLTPMQDCAYFALGTSLRGAGNAQLSVEQANPMPIEIDTHCQKPTQIPGLAHIVIAIQPDGTLHMQAFRLGAFNASYANKQDSVLAEIPALLAELRDELFAVNAQLSAEGS